MAASTIKIKRSSVLATPPQLLEGELAYSYASDTLFIGGEGGTTVIPISGGEQLVTSVNGQIGAVVLDFVDVGAAATFHTHVAAEITDFEAAVEALIPEAPVLSVNGQTGEVVLDYVDVGAAATFHTHVAAEITDFEQAVEALLPEVPVLSVNGQEGNVVLTYSDVGAAPLDHTHTASQITDFAAAVEALIPVTSVNGQTGEVVLTYTDVGAAAAVHTHVVADITDFTSAVDALIDAAVGDLTLIGLSDVNATGVTDGQVLAYDADTGTWVPADSTAALAFIDLTDVPTSYVGQAGRSLVVNNTEDGLLFTSEIDGGSF